MHRPRGIPCRRSLERDLFLPFPISICSAGGASPSRCSRAVEGRGQAAGGAARCAQDKDPARYSQAAVQGRATHCAAQGGIAGSTHCSMSLACGGRAALCDMWRQDTWALSNIMPGVDVTLHLINLMVEPFDSVQSGRARRRELLYCFRSNPVTSLPATLYSLCLLRKIP